MVASPVAILTVDSLCLLRMQLQLAPREPPLNGRFKPLGLSLTLAMHDDIIGIPLEGNVGILPSHPLIERIMQEKIGQQRAYDSTNAKDNLVLLDISVVPMQEQVL